MYAIAIKQQQYKTYTLSDSDAGAFLEVVPSRGGIITSWRIQGEEILYLDSERFTKPDLSVRGGIPILFPICGNLPDNTYTHNNKQYTLKQHGFARDLPWLVTEQVTQDMVSLTLKADSNDYTRTVYPFDFQLAFTYQIKGNTLEIRQRYTNHSAEPMPFSTGFHPYFWTPDKTQLQFEIPSSSYQNQHSPTFYPFSGSFDWSLDEIDVIFRQLTGTSATVTDNSRRRRLTLDYDDTYTTLVFWTVKGKDFYCLEPWSAPRNALNSGEHLLQLKPGASLETSFSIKVNFL